MILDRCLENIEVRKIIGAQNRGVENISQDTRENYSKNTLYVAVSGTQVDGHEFIDKAIEDGACAIVCEQLPDLILENITYIQVLDTAQVVGQIAHNFYGKPADALKVIAVTGTNGKTTIVNYVAQVLKSLGQKPLLLSTAGDYLCGEKITLPRKASSSIEIIELHKQLRIYVDQGATHVCLEATSHALVQGRLSGINIDVAVFTNLTQDHLDYHGSMQSYADAKSLLFSELMGSAIAIINYDDMYAQHMIKECYVDIVSYGKKKSYDYSFEITHMDHRGTELVIKNTSIETQIFGEFNMYNLSATYAIASELGFNEMHIMSAIKSIKNTSGRLESVDNEHDILALVDYAHTPDALENVLNTLQDINHNNIITVIGCGGDRDVKKRPLMVKSAQTNSDFVIFTSDNPRTESLELIYDDMKKGLDNNKKNYLFFDSRSEAIQKAVDKAQKGDIILVAGKGHEEYQDIDGVKHPFSDQKILIQYLKKKNN